MLIKNNKPATALKNKTTDILIKIITGLLMLIFVLSSYMFIHETVQSKKDLENYKQLVSLVEPVEDGNHGKDYMSRVRECAKMNDDFVGWLQIEGTIVNYPVVSTPSNPEYYLRRGFDGEYSQSGVPFLGSGCTLESNNILIHGHNMNNGTMFSALTNYADKSFFEQHKLIRFDTLEGTGVYEVIGAFYAKVYLQDENDVFRYYYWGGTLNEDQFDQYVRNVKNATTYDTGNTATYGDQLITLSTCSYHVEDGRFAVVAKKVSE